MKSLIVATAITFASTFMPTLSMAATYNCNSPSIGNIQIDVSASAIRVLAQDDGAEMGSADLPFDPSYKPRPEHVGAARYHGDNSCGEFQFIVDAKMASGQNGHATWAADCDSDGTGPTFVNYQCLLK